MKNKCPKCLSQTQRLAYSTKKYKCDSCQHVFEPKDHSRFNEITLTPKERALLEFVKAKHDSQLRKYTNEPYFTHPLKVALILQPYDLDAYHIPVALCHDLLEDTDCTATELFDKLIEIGYDRDLTKHIVNSTVQLTDTFTKVNYPNMNRLVRKQEEAVRLGSINYTAMNVKLADIIDNTESIVMHDKNFAKVYLEEIYYVLLNMRTGLCDTRLFIACCHSWQNGFNEINGAR